MYGERAHSELYVPSINSADGIIPRLSKQNSKLVNSVTMYVFGPCFRIFRDSEDGLENRVSTPVVFRLCGHQEYAGWKHCHGWSMHRAGVVERCQSIAVNRIHDRPSNGFTIGFLDFTRLLCKNRTPVKFSLYK